jgi:flagellar basal body P-ring formation protein FlgA
MMRRNFLLRSRPRKGFRDSHLAQAFRYLGSLGLIAALAAPAQAAENLAVGTQIRKAADRYMTTHVERLKSRLGPKTRIEYTIGALDPRLALAPCSLPLVVETRDSPQPNTRLNLQISCQQTSNWSIYLPVELALYRPAVIAVNALTHGNTVGPADVRLVDINVSQVNGQYLTSLDDAIGKDVKRSLVAGAPIVDQQLVPPLMVRRGEAVLINANSNIVAVKVSGIALTDGRLGEQIRIKNQSSSRIVSARITGPGQAEVPM